MAKITYVEHSGRAHVVEVANGASVMEGAVRNGIPGIDADCGGACACATCHVFVDPAWFERIGSRTEPERDMLDALDTLQPTSRLACQWSVGRNSRADRDNARAATIGRSAPHA